MKILVFSDSHGRSSNMEAAIEAHKPDRIFFLGDGLREVRELAQMYPAISICTVTGNNDWHAQEPAERIFTLAGTKFFLCHGHTFHVKETLLPLSLRARQEGASVALYGHTHVQNCVTTEDGLTLLNPGAIGFLGHYALLELAPGKEITVTLKKI